MPPEPTYYTTMEGETVWYHCCYCEAAGTEHVATDLELFTMHQQQRHDGRMEDVSTAPVSLGGQQSSPVPASPEPWTSDPGGTPENPSA